jgi:hypothetical protein
MIFEDIVTIEFSMFAILILFALIATVIFQANYRKKKRYSRFLESMLIQMVNERIDMIEENVPKEMLKLHYVIPIIESIEIIIKDPFWDLIKQRLIEYYLLPEIRSHILSDNWLDIVLALRAIKHSPQVGFEGEVLKHFDSKHSLLRFATLDCALRFNTYTSILAALRSMAKEPRRLEYPYRDAFIYSNKLTHDFLNQIYREVVDPTLRLCCLKVLSLKTGYITYDDILWELGTDKVETHWWAIRSIENCPSEDGIELLEQLLEHKAWEIRALSIYCISSLKVVVSFEKVEKLVHDEHYWVRFMALLALKFHGPEGEDLINKLMTTLEGDLKDLCENVLAIPEKSFVKGLQKFFPINQDPLLIMESIEAKT